MTEKERREIFKAINGVSNKVNETSRKLDEFIQMLNAESNRKISITGDGVDGLAELLAVHDSALDELAEIVSKLGGV